MMSKYHEPMVEIVRSHPAAKIPEYKTTGAAGADLHVVEAVTLYPGETRAIGTGLKIELPHGYEAQIRSRSGTSLDGLVVANSPGTIDSDYRGEIRLIMRNNGRLPRKIAVGDRLAQIVIAPVSLARFVETTEDKLTVTTRGDGGFGSTGKV